MKLKKKEAKKFLMKRINYFVIGNIKFSNKENYGDAFVIDIRNKQRIIIPRNNINKSLDGDLVQVRIIKSKTKFKNKKIIFSGKVLKIITRKKQKLIGILKIYSISSKLNNLSYRKYGLVIICRNNFNIDINASDIERFNNNDKVLVEIISWKKKFKNPLGKIIKCFGKYGEYNTELTSLLEEYNIPYKFSKKSEYEAKKIFMNCNLDLNKRRDMRSINTFTIDPIDSKDFDDALSVRKINSKLWEIGIHISDVSFYLKENSFLDKEVYSRATSIYFVGNDVPMLPRILSNNLCSINPKEDKLGFSSVFKINKEGKILNIWMGKTIIKSDRKFTYDEVQKIIHKKKGYFYKEINILFFLSKILKKNRLQSGSIFLDKMEVKFKLDNKNNPISIYLEKNNHAHTLIEEFMLLTNRKVSEYISLKFIKKNSFFSKPYIYRVHDKPDTKKVFFLKNVIKPLGYSLDLKNLKNSINNLLYKIKGRPEQNMIENLILRSMSKAKYSTKNIGHYGLSFIHYTHFTSPIRRYSDIIAHRLLNYYLNKKKKNIKIKSTMFYELQSKHCSYKERLAIDIEREFIKFMKIKFLKKFLGMELYGVISGFTNWNIYIDLLSFQAEGVIKIRNINEDNYKFESKSCRIIGNKKKKVYYLGEKIKVKLIKINLGKRKIFLELIGKI